MFHIRLIVGAFSLWGLSVLQALTLQPVATPTPDTIETPQLPQVSITSPQTGAALQGNISVTGTTVVPGFEYAELTFAYHEHPTDTWFLISSSEEAVLQGMIAQWDTSTITDGIYDLRLTVTLVDGERVSAIVSGIRVRNYSPIETDTPTPVTPTSTPAPGELPPATITPTPTQTPIPPSATPLPTNSLELTNQDFALNLGKGALATIGIFALIGLYQTIKKIRY